jgi:hypothetical protein
VRVRSVSIRNRSREVQGAWQRYGIIRIYCPLLYFVPHAPTLLVRNLDR